MKQRPILFSDAMVRAILDGRKTQTRRAVKPQPAPIALFDDHAWGVGPDGIWANGHGHQIRCPFGIVGDLLYVREAWTPADKLLFGTGLEDPCCIAYRADQIVLNHEWRRDPPKMDTSGVNWDQVRWKPSIHMPKWAARIWLRVTNVRVERVQDISPQDCAAEGTTIPVGENGRPLLRITGEHPPVEYLPKDYDGPDIDRAHFASLWDSINEARGFGWESNCWVWVVEFERCDAPEVAS